MKLLSILGLWMMVASCQGYAFDYVGMGQTVETLSHNTITGNPNVDILFVIDNSKSMADKQQNLSANANTFITEFSKTNLNYHLGIVTTDMFNPNDAGRLRMAPGASASGQPFWTAPNPNDTQLDQERQAIVAGFVATVGILGIDGNLNEAGIMAPIKALAPSDPAVAAANQAFFRADADLAVIILTDEDDCSFTPENFNTVEQWTDDQACYRNTQVLFDPNVLVNAYAGLKGGDLGKVRLGIIGGGLKQADGSFAPRSCIIDGSGNPSDQCGCWVMRDEDWFCTSINTDYGQPCTTASGCSNGDCASTSGGTCDTPLCHSTPARRYVQFYSTLTTARQALGFAQGTFIDTVCQNTYASTLLSIAHNVVMSSCFGLPTPGVDVHDVAVSITHKEPNGSTSLPQTLPRYDPQDATAACRDCAACPGGAWQYSDSQVCLACGLQLKEGDNISVGTLLQTP